MAIISVTLPSDGTTADVSDVNTPITTIVNEINGQLDNANIKTAAAITGSKLADASIDIGAKASTWDGWIAVSDSWAYASATTITVPTDATTKYSVGDKIKIVQSGSTKYFYITVVTSTVITVNGGSDYTVANSAISGIYYSKATTPLGFPQWFTYTPTYTNFSLGNGTVNYSTFTMIGKTVHFKLKITLGNTSSVSGLISILTPTSVTPTTSLDTMHASVQLNDATSVRWSALCAVASATQMALYVLNGSANYVATSSTVPFTWTTNDQIMVSGTYEAA